MSESGAVLRQLMYIDLQVLRFGAECYIANLNAEEFKATVRYDTQVGYITLSTNEKDENFKFGFIDCCSANEHHTEVREGHRAVEY